MVDTHCHLDHCDAPVAHLVTRARKAGVDRMLAIGMTGESCRHALAAADEHDEMFVCDRPPPARVRGLRRRRPGGAARSSRAHPKARAVGEAGLDYKRDYAPREDQRRSFVAQIELARDARPAARGPHARGRRRHARPARRATPTGSPVIIHCFSLTDHVEQCVERGYYCSFAGNVTYPKATDLQRAAASVPDELLLVETDAPFLSPQERRGKPNEPAFVTATAEFVAELRGTTYEAIERLVDRQRRPALRVVSATPACEPGARKPRAPRALRHPAQPRAGPELPGRRQHARRDRPPRRARRAATWCSRSAAASAC